MLVIRAEQFRMLSEAVTNRFRGSVETHLLKCWPHRLGGEDSRELRETVERLIARAQSYGIDGERNIVRFIDAQVLLGEGFELQPSGDWALGILQSGDLTAAAKALQIWEGAKRRRQTAASAADGKI
jgi:hypothetical protein